MSKHEYFKACNEFNLLSNEYEALLNKGGNAKRLASLERKIAKLAVVIDEAMEG